MELKFFKTKISLKDDSDNGDTNSMAYEAYASVFGNVDKDNDIVERGAFAKTLKERPIFPVLWLHNPSEVIGGAKLHEDNHGLRAEVQLNPEVARAREIYALIKQGVVVDHSFGFRTIKSDMTVEDEVDIRVLKELALLEISPLPAGFAANPEAGIDLVKAVNRALEVKRVVAYQNLPLADTGTPWDAGKAKANIRRWATGEDGEIDWPKYRKAFVWYDPEAADTVAGYKLPIGNVFGNSLNAVPRAIMAAGGVVMGARGGIDIPESEMNGVQNHLAKYYKRLEMTPPWDKSSSEPIENHSEDRQEAEPVNDHSDETKALILSWRMSLANQTAKVKEYLGG